MRYFFLTAVVVLRKLVLASTPTLLEPLVDLVEDCFPEAAVLDCFPIATVLLEEGCLD